MELKGARNSTFDETMNYGYNVSSGKNDLEIAKPDRVEIRVLGGVRFTRAAGSGTGTFPKVEHEI